MRKNALDLLKEKIFMAPQFYKTSKLFSDYLAGDETLQPFYSEALFPDWEKLAGKVENGFNQQKIIDELILQNSKSTDKSVLENIKVLQKGKTLMVVTGQQLGLMVSPLYVIYKTLSTIKLAEKLNKEVKGYNFVPVYWLEGEDHDFAEVNNFNFFDSAAQLASLSLSENESEAGLSMNKRVLGNEIENLLENLRQNLQQTDFSKDLFSRLESMYKSGQNWLDVFTAHLATLFSGYGLLLFNAGTNQIKELSKTFFEKIIIENESLVNAFTKQSGQLNNAGYKNQVNIQQDRTYLFLSYKGGARQPILRKNGGFYLAKSDQYFSMEALLDILDKHPEWFSSTVLTRPLWQSWLLPTVSYIAGAAEIAYWGQLRSAFHQCRLVMPHLQPRHTLTVIEPKIDRLISKYDIAVDKIPKDKTRFIKDYFNTNQLGQVNTIFNDYEGETIKVRERIKQLVSEIDPTLTAPAEKTFAAILSSIEKLQNRLVNRVREKDTLTQNHLSMVFDSILPNGNLQERVISSVYFENKYGEQWIKSIYKELKENFQQHLIVRI